MIPPRLRFYLHLAPHIRIFVLANVHQKLPQQSGTPASVQRGRREALRRFCGQQLAQPAALDTFVRRAGCVAGGGGAKVAPGVSPDWNLEERGRSLPSVLRTNFAFRWRGAASGSGSSRNFVKTTEKEVNHLTAVLRGRCCPATPPSCGAPDSIIG